MPRKTDKKTKSDSISLLVLGLDEEGKPRGARFDAVRDDLIKAAVGLGCVVVRNPTGELAVLGAKLPVGRVHASGKTFIPNIRRDLYDKLTAMGAKTDDRVQAEQNQATASSTGVVGQAVTNTDTARGRQVRGALPVDWEDVAVGDMILAQESPDDGWWVSIVVARDGDLLTLRYRDFSKESKFVRHISTIGRIYPALN